MMEKRGMGQSWSLDIILAFVIFMLIVGIFYTLLSNNKKTTIQDVQLEASTLSGALDSSSGINSTLSIIREGLVDKDKLQSLYTADYNNLKTKFGIKGDFFSIDQYRYRMLHQNVGCAFDVKNIAFGCLSEHAHAFAF